MEIKPTIEINIEQFVLHGFSPADKFRIGKAVENQLALLFSQEGPPSSLKNSTSQPFLDGGSFQMPANASAGLIGSEIAGSVYSGFNSE